MPEPTSDNIRTFIGYLEKQYEYDEEHLNELEAFYNNSEEGREAYKTHWDHETKYWERTFEAISAGL